MFSFQMPVVKCHYNALSLSIVLHNHVNQRDYAVNLTVGRAGQAGQFNKIRFREWPNYYLRSIEPFRS
ncbi:hypothetical protein PY650_19270 [Rhizobium calliandrae]|uniref:Uncharacterized protein n=1 Tax=Rhizobium calliandrae TaxID=1312182 RepID=A0ABT7KGK7_9HYPH|nr:hypothetical protein [Rhizobium calliandrae]MDL2407761.1 hypothetical protein [Rhizobium calliandrae]